MFHRQFRGFTLIELLIVVAIIAILAAIAVPNFLETQVRAKVSRAQADMRGMAISIEAYKIDWNVYPPNDGLFYATPVELTTPVSYLNSRPSDPFSDGRDIAARVGVSLPPERQGDEELYSYWRIVTLEQGAEDPARNASPLVVDVNGGGNQRAFVKYGAWAQLSIGPDGELADPIAPDISFTGVLSAPTVEPWGYSFDVPYDATNGTISFGNVFRTQLNTEGTVHDPDL